MTSLVLKSRIVGHILIKDKSTGKILIDTKNDIHPKNVSLAIARGLAGSPGADIYSVKLGNGGTIRNDLGVHVPRSPNIISSNSTLYNTTYTEIISNSSPMRPEGNSISHQQDANLFSVVICVLEISITEPVNQLASPTNSDATNADNSFAFDEMGLFTSDDLMLTHAIFPYPVLKTAEQELQIVYSLTIESEQMMGE